MTTLCQCGHTKFMHIKTNETNPCFEKSCRCLNYIPVPDAAKPQLNEPEILSKEEITSKAYRKVGNYLDCQCDKGVRQSRWECNDCMRRIMENLKSGTLEGNK